MGVYAVWYWFCEGCTEASQDEFDYESEAEESWRKHLHDDHERTDDAVS